ncbi:hypothetical protein R6V09_39040 [Streptomyces sp. W16]|uniref:hypothetical protein n=1 Tax=Streptomyces sp. W16 TaxID=3076631 RepID=UPI00295A7033|nr:hypothetical protein [Streptomyces sp. W16]MDV9176106.1 hypothetical protein [Streptomyces sp. W16]
MSSSKRNTDRYACPSLNLASMPGCFLIFSSSASHADAGGQGERNVLVLFT